MSSWMSFLLACQIAHRETTIIVTSSWSIECIMEKIHWRADGSASMLMCSTMVGLTSASLHATASYYYFSLEWVSRSKFTYTGSHELAHIRNSTHEAPVRNSGAPMLAKPIHRLLRVLICITLEQTFLGCAPLNRSGVLFRFSGFRNILLPLSTFRCQFFF
jgi:hypothetical protein